MSDKIEVCGKMCVVGNWYLIKNTSNHVLKLRQDGVFIDEDGYECLVTSIIEFIEGINGEVLEDAPYKPKEGDWCLFSDREPFDKFVISKYLSKTPAGYYEDLTMTAWVYCKPFDPSTFDWSK